MVIFTEEILNRKLHFYAAIISLPPREHLVNANKILTGMLTRFLIHPSNPIHLFYVESFQLFVSENLEDMFIDN